MKPSSTDYCHVCFSDINLWETLDRDASEARMARNATVDATVEVQRYMNDPPLERSEEPLVYWRNHKNVYPHLLYWRNNFYVRRPHQFLPNECFPNVVKLSAKNGTG